MAFALLYERIGSCKGWEHYFLHISLVFARKLNLPDANCTWLVANGVHTELMKTLDCDKGDVSINLQHAVFSALKNLAIPGA